MVYRLLFRLVLSRLDAEFAHQLAYPVLFALGLPPLAQLVRRWTAPRPTLRGDFLGIRVDSPFGVAAGFDKNARFLRGLWALGFGHVEIGTVTALPQRGNPRPRLFRLAGDHALINRMGFNNDGARAVARRLERVRRRGPRPLIGVNIGKSRVVEVGAATADYVTSARLLAPLADYLVVNVSSPNTPGLRDLQALELLRPLLAAVCAVSVPTPVLVKIAPELTDAEIRAVVRIAAEVGLSGVVATNTTTDRVGLTSDPRVIREAGYGGLSGRPLKGRSLEALRSALLDAPEGFVVISAGGVEDRDDVRDRLAAGAAMVQGYTGFLYSGPSWAAGINRQLSTGC